jgi:hypothetical protein
MQRGRGVQGTITGRDVLIHSFTILRHWGPSCYLRCLKAVVSRRSCTFLEVAWIEAEDRPDAGTRPRA